VATGTGKQSQGAVPGAGVGGGAGYRVPGTAGGGTGFGDNDGHREAELGGGQGVMAMTEERATTVLR
jgi:hypothetical protein